MQLNPIPQILSLINNILGTTNQVIVTDSSSNTVTLSTPQDIATTSSPTFTGLFLTGSTVSFTAAGNITATQAGSGLSFYTSPTPVSGTVSGQMLFHSGNTINAGTGPIVIQSGSVLGASGGPYTSGAVQIESGSVLAGITGGSGQFILRTGTGRGVGSQSGNMTLTVGSALDGATQGNITLSSGTGNIILNSLTGLLKGTSGVVSAITDNSATWNAAQAGHANLTSLSGMATTVGLVKQTSANTFGIDATSYLPITGGTLTGNLLFTDATYDIGATGATRPRDLFLSRNATIGGLTATRIPFAGVGGLLSDVSTLNWVSPTLFTPQIQTTGPVAFGTAISSVIGANCSITTTSADTWGGQFVVSSSGNNPVGLIGSATSTKNAFGATNILGLSFGASWTPTTLTGNRSMVAQVGAITGAAVTSPAGSTNTMTLSAASGYRTSFSFTQGGSGVLTISDLRHFEVRSISTSGSPTIPVQHGFYCPSLTAATENWGLGINTANNYINGSLRIGSAVAPTVALDVTGQITANNVVTGTYFQTSTAATANSTGTVAIVAKDANLLTANAGWMPIKKSDGTTVYIPYWD
jgi:hypothetical protein